MKEEEIYHKTTEVLKNFKNAEQKMKESATFNVVVQMLVRGATTYEVIEQLIQLQDDFRNAFVQYCFRDTRPIVMPNI